MPRINAVILNQRFISDRTVQYREIAMDYTHQQLLDLLEERLRVDKT